MQGYFFDLQFPNNLPAIWEQHFGFLAQTATIVPGEWGGRYGNNGNPSDKIWQDKLVQYFKDNNICNSFYWTFNPNSGDTGGILQDDWRTPWQNKIDMLNNYFNSCR